MLWITSSAYGAVSPHRQDSQVQESRVEVGVVPLTVIPSDPLEKVLLSVPTTCYSAGLDILVAEGEMLPPGETAVISLKWELRLSPRHFGFLPSLNEQRAKSSYYAGWGDWASLPRGIWTTSPHWRKEEYVWNMKNPLECLLVLPCSVIKFNRKWQQSKSGRIANGPNPTGAEMKIWVTPPGKDHNRLRCFRKQREYRTESRRK